MAEETTISTPVTDAEVTTSTSEVSEDTTSQVEVTEDTPAAETETSEVQTEETPEEPEKLYAGKYKSVEELEKGYAEAQKTLTQNLQMKSKYEELLKKQEQQEARLLERAKENGFNTVNDAQIAKQIAQAEYDEFVNGLNYYVEPESQVQVQQYLGAYYNTGDISYLNEAKRYYPSNFLENVAIGKVQMRNRLKAQYEQENKERIARAEQELAEALRTDYGEFIDEVKQNTGASKALQMFCNAGFIQSKEDMEVFKSVYGDIVSAAKEQAIKEYEAQKVIDATKQKASIQTDSNAGITTNNELPTGEELRQNPQLYRDAVKKYGMDKVDEIIMKG